MTARSFTREELDALATPPAEQFAASVASGNGWVTEDRYNAGVATRDRTLVVAIQHEEYTE